MQTPKAEQEKHRRLARVAKEAKTAAKKNKGKDKAWRDGAHTKGAMGRLI